MQTKDLPKIILVDMNSFFASVEQQANPFLRGRPVGVCASLHKTSCVIAASKEAKRLGIGTGASVYRAQKICPRIVLLQADPDKYREVHHRINRIFCDYSGNVEPYSIDESFIDLRGLNLNPLLVGAEIKKRIRREVGEWLTCSVGVGDNKFLAKLASEMETPDGLSVVFRAQLREAYSGKKLTDLWGISRGWEKRLAQLGLSRPEQVLNYPVQNLISVFGKSGFYLWQRINGLEEDEISSEESRIKSFGHSWVLNFRTTDKLRLQKVILCLAEKAARRMRRANFYARGFYLSVICVDGTHFGKSQVLPEPIISGEQFCVQSLKIWESWQFKNDVMYMAVGFTHLLQQSIQPSLFTGKSPEDLLACLDQINNKYGEFTIRSALLANTNDYAPDAIAFGK